MTPPGRGHKPRLLPSEVGSKLVRRRAFEVVGVYRIDWEQGLLHSDFVLDQKINELKLFNESTKPIEENMIVMPCSTYYLKAQINSEQIASTDMAILSELLGVRMLLLNLLYPVGRGESLSAEKVQAIVSRVDAEKLSAAIQCLEQNAKRRN